MSLHDPLQMMPPAIRTLGPEDPGGAPQQKNILSIVHGLLRGRYVIAIAASACGAAIGCAAGYFIPTPKYRAEGIVHVQSVLPKILHENEQTQMPPMFASKVAYQASLLQHDRVISKAMSSGAWKELGRDIGAAGEREFRGALKVVINHEIPDTIVVSFTDKEARAAFIAVQEVIAAYQDRFGSPRDNLDLQKSILMQQKKELEGQRGDLEKAIATDSSQFETSDLASLENHYLTRLLELDSKVEALEVFLTERNVDIRKPPPPTGTPPLQEKAPSLQQTPEFIAKHDAKMAQLLGERLAAQQLVQRLQLEGYMEKHPDFQRASAELSSIESSIQSYCSSWNASRLADPEVAPIVPETETPAQTVDRYLRLKQLADSLRQRTDAISKGRRKLDADRREIVTIQGKLDETNSRIDDLGLQTQVQDRIGGIEVILPGAPPSAPAIDSRKKLAFAGFVFGGGIPLALVGLIGLRDRRVRYSDQAANPMLSAPLLGILPELPRNLESSEQASAAVHCIHQIRTLLQLSGPKRQAYMVTSPTAGDGKTSLSLSLAMSFTASGARTVLVDFDLVGRGMSSRFKVVPTHSLGKALLDGSLNGCTNATQIPGLFLVAAGLDDERIASRITSDNVERIIDELKQRFDIVVIDTGPILGSLEANMVAAAADGVVMVVGRGQQQHHVQSALAHLVNLRATVLGLVFNRAAATDFNRSHSSSSFRSASSTAIQRVVPPPPSPATDGLDPLPRSVAIDLNRSRAD